MTELVRNADDLPLPEPGLPPCARCNKPTDRWEGTYYADQVRAAIAAAVLAEREWWREIAEQLIACHDEPTCPAVTLARERLDGHIRKGE